MSITAESFEYVADLVRRRSAIHLDRGKEYLVESRLLPLARAASAADVDAYVRALRSGRLDGGALDAVVEALTTNETSWFRDGAPFQALSEHVVPAVVAAAGPAAGERPPLRVWSAACSSGQEPYSIAMQLLDAPVDMQILATDLSETMIRRAREGRYSQLEINRGLPAAMLVRHFARRGSDWEVTPALRERITFLRHNLLDPAPAGGPFDVVFLRNVLIYFDLRTKRAVLDRVRRSMAPGGFLFLGAAETTIGIDDTWERVAVGRSSVYRAPARRAA